MVVDFEEEISQKHVSKDSLAVPLFMAPLSHICLRHIDEGVVILLSPESVYTDLY